MVPKMQQIALTVLCLTLSTHVFAQSVQPAYITFGTGVTVLLAFTVYLYRKIRQTIKEYRKSPT